MLLSTCSELDTVLFYRPSHSQLWEEVTVMPQKSGLRKAPCLAQGHTARWWEKSGVRCYLQLNRQHSIVKRKKKEKMLSLGSINKK